MPPKSHLPKLLRIRVTAQDPRVKVQHPDCDTSVTDGRGRARVAIKPPRWRLSRPTERESDATPRSRTAFLRRPLGLRRTSGREWLSAFPADSSEESGPRDEVARGRSHTQVPKSGHPAQPRASCSSSMSTPGSILSSVTFDPAEFVPAVVEANIPFRGLLQTGYDRITARAPSAAPRSACRRSRTLP